MSDSEQYSIHPAIGIGRVGNSTNSFYLAPATIGGLPIEADLDGNPVVKDGKPMLVTQFKDAAGRVRRQAASFRIYRTVPGQPGQRVAVSLDDPSIEKIVWKVHVANKKAAWWNYVPLLGDLMFGKFNSYQTWADTPPAWKLQSSWTNPRNAGTAQEKRQTLIVDPGPRV